MRIGFLASTSMVLERYWNKLYDKADCWWGVKQPQLLHDLLRKKNINKIVYHYDKHIINPNKKFGNKYVSTNPGQSENIFSEMINPDLWIAEGLNKLNYIPKKAFWVQTFHSLPIKKHFFYKPVLEYDLFLLPGEYHKEEFVKRLNLKWDDERLKLVGWPRVDDLISGTYEREGIMKNAGLDPSKKTVMYAPTWGWGYGNNSFFARWSDREAEVFEHLCREATNLNLNIIVRLHSLSFQVNNEVLLEIARKYKVLWQTTETSIFYDDPNQFMWITDILISDLSGIIAEFMVLDRPIIYIDPDERVDPWIDSDMPKNFRVGHVVRTPEELCEAIKDSILCPGRHSKERKKLASKLFCNLDGNATEVAIEAILNFAASKGLK